MIGAIDIGGTKIAVGMVNEAGHVLARTEQSTTAQCGPGEALQNILAMLHETAMRAGGILRGIGIGCTGPVDPFTGHIGFVELLPGWERFNLVGELACTLGVPVAMENDADAAALGEAMFGAGHGAKRFIYVTVSTGIGAGLVFDGELYRGVDGAHSEIGHHVIDPSGPRCLCGAHGCWETLAAGPWMARWVEERDPQGEHVAPPVTAQRVCEAAERGDPLAREAVAREARYLGLGLANLVTLFAPDVIALGGGVMRSLHLFKDTIRETIRTSCGFVPHEKTRLVAAALGDDVGLVGAACAWLHRFHATA